MTLIYITMHKKIILIISSLLLTLQGIACTNNIKSGLGKPGINNGFIFHVGVAFPRIKVKYDKWLETRQFLGVEPNLEIGHQWYFIKNEKIGFGLKVGWLQIGCSSYEFDGTQQKSFNVNVSLLKVAPQVTLTLKKNAFLDIYFDIAPTLFKGGHKIARNNYVYTAIGFTYTPGIAFRINSLILGLDLGFGSLDYIGRYNPQNDDSDIYVQTGLVKASILYPRIYGGFKF